MEAKIRACCVTNTQLQLFLLLWIKTEVFMPILQLQFQCCASGGCECCLCTEAPEAAPAEPWGAQSQPWNPGTALFQQETSKLPEPGAGKTDPQLWTCFIPSCYTSKHQGATPDVTAADSQGSHNIFCLRTNHCLGKNPVLDWTILQDCMGKAEEVWKAGNQNTTSLSSY